MIKKAVVVHAGARDNYEVAYALYEADQLDSLVTEVYWPDSLRLFAKELAEKRSRKGLPFNATTISFRALFFTARMALKSSFILNNLKDESLSRRAYHVARKHGAHLFCYSYYANFAFSQLAAFPGQRKLLFQLHPHPVSVKEILDSELLLHPQAAESILYENEMQYTASYLQKLASEPLLADHIAVASTYTKKTLVAQGIEASKISVIPYGVDAEQFPQRTAAPANKTLKLLFIGSIVQRKGLIYLLNALRVLNNAAIELTLCGRGFIDHQLLAAYTDLPITVKKGLSRKELVAEMHGSDLFILPTLSEGFAHVILEAMSAGVPVITTDHSSGPDIITNCQDGWIVPAKSVEAIVSRISWALNNKDQLFNIGEAAAITAKRYTWERFRTGIRKFYSENIYGYEAGS